MDYGFEPTDTPRTDRSVKLENPFLYIPFQPTTRKGGDETLCLSLLCLLFLKICCQMAMFAIIYQVSKNIELGLAAFRGEKGPAYDRIVLNAGIVDHLLGCDCAEDVSLALERAKEAIDSGKAHKRLLNYMKMSHKVKE